MKQNLKVGIIGDYNPGYDSHTATSRSIEHASAALSIDTDYSWLDTESINNNFEEINLSQFDALWCAPGSPYKSFNGAIRAIKFARENKIPFIGTCGGFQHSLIEYARNVIGISDADHEELSPESGNLLISRLVCSLVGTLGTVQILPDTKVFDVYRKNIIQEQFRCSFGINHTYIDKINRKPLVISGFDPEGEPRIFELTDHSFYIGTLFVPQLSSSEESPHPLIVKFLQAALGF